MSVKSDEKEGGSNWNQGEEKKRWTGMREEQENRFGWRVEGGGRERGWHEKKNVDWRKRAARAWRWKTRLES